MSTLLHAILDRAPALATLAQECKGCHGTLCKGCHGTRHEGGCPYVSLSAGCRADKLLDFAARQIRQARRFDYHVTRTLHANLEALCVCLNVLLLSWRWRDSLLFLPLPRRSSQPH